MKRKPACYALKKISLILLVLLMANTTKVIAEDSPYDKVIYSAGGTQAAESSSLGEQGPEQSSYKQSDTTGIPAPVIKKDKPKRNFNLDSTKENLGTLQIQARTYRDEGFKLQGIGNLDGALSMYQKAIELDPTCAATYNDLGVLYEMRGASDAAEQVYLRAINTDPNLLAPYSNLAIIYENKRQLNQALYYWRKRIELGSADDPWVQKAIQRRKDIQAVMGNFSYNPNEDKVISLLKEVGQKKELEKKDNLALAKSYYEKAKISFDRGDKVSALKLSTDAMQLDPDNKEIKEFVDKVQLRLLSN